MTELSLFPQQIPPAAISVGADPAAKRRPHQPGAPAEPTSSAASKPGRDENASEHLLGLLDALVDALSGLVGVQLEECLRLIGRFEARLAGVKAQKVGELAEWRGKEHAAAVLRGSLKQSRGGAKKEVQFAERLADLPKTAKALATGDVTPQAARAIADAAAHTPVDEAELLDAAQSKPADTFARTVRDHVNERTGQLDLEERRRRQRSQREAKIKQESDGMYKLFGTFDPLAGARIETALAAMAKQRWQAEDPKNRATTAQRYADALEALITQQASGTGVPKAQRTNLLVIADYDLLAGQLANPRQVDGTPLAPSELLQLALEANILPAVFGTKGQPLWLGHKCRHASTAQRIALAARDRGCAVCGASHSYCQPHHIVHWENGGPTDIDNLCLLCGDCHHKQIHELGAKLVRSPDGTFTLRPAPNQTTLAGRSGKARAGKARARKARIGNKSPKGRISHTSSAYSTCDASQGTSKTVIKQPLRC